MELFDFSKNEDSISKQAHIESALLWGDPDAVSGAGITICIPTIYKRPDLLKEAIESAVNQKTDIPYRIIVVDNDDDFDNTGVCDLVKSFNDERICYYKNKENLQIFGNLNRCAALAKTEYFALLHDDDLLLANYITAVSGILKKYDGKIHGLSNIYKYIGEPLVPDPDSPKKGTGLAGLLVLKKAASMIKPIKALIVSMKKIVKPPVSANLFLGVIMGPPTCGLLFRRDIFLESGGFNEKYFPYDDWRFNIFFSSKYNMYRYRKQLSLYRIGANIGLKKESLLLYNDAYRMIFLSLKNYTAMCNILFSLLKKDFMLRINTPYIEPTEKSVMFKLIEYIYHFFYI